MKEKIEFNDLSGETWEHSGEWSRDDAIEWSFMEGSWQAEAEAENQKLEELKELIKKFHQERSNKNDQ